MHIGIHIEIWLLKFQDNKPIFQDCASYAPKIEEGAPNGSPVIKVHALDKDKGVNGQVKYSIVQQPNQKGTKFTVDEETGELFTNKVFDREGDDGKTVSVTVKAIDSGEPSLEGVCSFTVEITDVNVSIDWLIDLKIGNLKIQDNPPLFDRQKYIENVKQDTNIGTNILRVSASDEDADNNGAIRYSLAAPFQRDDLNYFDIQQESGWIFLKRPLDVSRPPTSIHFVHVHFLFLRPQLKREPANAVSSFGLALLQRCSSPASFNCSNDFAANLNFSSQPESPCKIFPLKEKNSSPI